MKTTIKIMMSALILHLLYTNAELLISAKNFATNGATMFDKVALTAFALSYSLISALCVFHLQKIAPILVFGVLDGFAVYLRINVNQEPFLLITAVFFGLYTSLLILFCFLISKQNRMEQAKAKQSESKNEIENKANEKQNLFLLESKTKANIKQNESKIEIENKANEKQSEIKNESELILLESKTETIVKQLVCKLNPMKSEQKRLELIEKQPPEIQKQLLEKYGYTEKQIENQPKLF